MVIDSIGKLRSLTVPHCTQSIGSEFGLRRHGLVVTVVTSALPSALGLDDFISTTWGTVMSPEMIVYTASNRYVACRDNACLAAVASI